MKSGPGKNDQEPKKKKYNGQQQKEMDCHEPHPAPNENFQGIQWTERPTGALVAAGSLWPWKVLSELLSPLAAATSGILKAIYTVPTTHVSN